MVTRAFLAIAACAAFFPATLDEQVAAMVGDTVEQGTPEYFKAAPGFPGSTRNQYAFYPAPGLLLRFETGTMLNGKAAMEGVSAAAVPSLCTIADWEETALAFARRHQLTSGGGCSEETCVANKLVDMMIACAFGVSQNDGHGFEESGHVFEQGGDSRCAPRLGSVTSDTLPLALPPLVLQGFSFDGGWAPLVIHPLPTLPSSSSSSSSLSISSSLSRSRFSSDLLDRAVRDWCHFYSSWRVPCSDGLELHRGQLSTIRITAGRAADETVAQSWLRHQRAGGSSGDRPGATSLGDGTLKPTLFIINLARRTDRWAHTEGQLLREVAEASSSNSSNSSESNPWFHVERFVAFDGATYHFTPADLRLFGSDWEEHYKEFGEGFIEFNEPALRGNVLSHYTVWKACLRQAEPWCVVLNDDLTFARNFQRKVRKMVDGGALPDDALVIWLGLEPGSAGFTPGSPEALQAGGVSLLVDEFTWPIDEAYDPGLFSRVLDDGSRGIGQVREHVNPQALAYVVTAKGVRDLVERVEGGRGFPCAIDCFMNQFLRERRKVRCRLFNFLGGFCPCSRPDCALFWNPMDWAYAMLTFLLITRCGRFLAGLYLEGGACHWNCGVRI